MSSADEEYDNEEQEELEQDNEEVEEEEQSQDEADEGEEGEEEEGKKIKRAKRKFEEQLPPKKPSLSSLFLLLPGRGAEKVEVKVKNIPGRITFEKRYRAYLKKIRRENILKQLESDPDGKRAFFQLEEEEGEANAVDDIDDEDEDDLDEDEQPKLPLPFWLPFLLSDDEFYLERVLAAMYGYALNPPAPYAEEPPKDGDEDEAISKDDEIDEEVGGVTSFSSLPSEGIVKSLSKKSLNEDVQPLTIPKFLHPNYPFYIVFERASEEWHLLDLHPLIWTHQYHAAMAEKRRQAEEAEVEREENEKAEDEENNEEDDQEENEEAEEHSAREESEEAEEEDLQYDLDSIQRIDALALAALFSPTALRWMLLQPQLVSLNVVEEWMSKDPCIGIPLLSKIQSSLAAIKQNDAPRIPYRIPRPALDFNFFFQPLYLFSLDPSKIINYDRGLSSDYENKIVSFRSTAAQKTLQALISAGIEPSKPIELRHFERYEGIQLSLWLLLLIPKSVLLKWSAMGATVRTPEEPKEEEEEEEEEEAEDVSITESLLRRRIAREEAEKQKQNPPEPSRPFLPSPFLSQILLELRRRYKRIKNGRGRSKYSLDVCLERVYKSENLEDGLETGDPEVTATFSLDSMPAAHYSLREQMLNELSDIMSHSVVRYQRLYQSDLALLLLCMTPPEVTLQSLGQKGTESTFESALPPQKTAVRIRKDPRRAIAAVSSKAYSFFSVLLHDKLKLKVSPLRQAQSGTLRLLYAALHSFCSADAAMILLDLSPQYELFGINGRCPLPELVACWLEEQRKERLCHIDMFINMFWDELYFRSACGLYEPNVILFLNAHYPELMGKVTQRYTQYAGVIDLLGGSLHRHSAIHRTTFRRSVLNSSTGRPSTGEGEGGEDTTIRELVLVSILNPSSYHSEYIREEKRIVAAFESLPMSPKTFYTAETLYRLLFVVPNVDLVAIRYMMVVQGVTTVRENPFYKEINALEYAITTQNTVITNLIIGLGFSMDNIIDEGRMTTDFYAENMFDLGDLRQMKETARFNSKITTSDPRRHYGILANEAQPKSVKDGFI